MKTAVFIGTLAIVIGTLSYLLIIDVPDYVENPWKFRYKYGPSHVLGIIMDVMYKTGFNELSVIRYFSTVFSSSAESTDEIKITDQDIGGVKCRIFAPKSNDLQSGPGVVYFHGGGFDRGSIDTHQEITLQLAKYLEVPVISVGYRLAPEHPYPAARDDGVKVLRSVLEHADKYHIDAHRVAVMGDSSGGLIAMSSYIRLVKLQQKAKKSQGEKAKLLRPKLLALIYPCLQAQFFDLPSHQAFRKLHPYIYKNAFMLPLLRYLGQDYAHIEEFTSSNHTELGVRLKAMISLDYHFLPESVIPRDYTPDPQLRKYDNPDLAKIFKKVTSPMISPGLLNDFTSLPAIYLLTTGHDPCRDETLLLARKLQQMEHPVQLHYHAEGFSGMFPADQTVRVEREAWRQMIEHLSSML